MADGNTANTDRATKTKKSVIMEMLPPQVVAHAHPQCYELVYTGACVKHTPMKQFIKTSEVNATCNSTTKGLALPKQQKSTYS